MYYMYMYTLIKCATCKIIAINYALLHKILNFMYIVHVIMYNNYYTLLFLLLFTHAQDTKVIQLKQKENGNYQ